MVTTTIIYIFAGLTSLVTAWLFARKKWDGILQWLLVIQNTFIGVIMLCRAFETLNLLSSDSADMISAIGFFLIQTWISWFLYTSTTLSQDTNKEEPKE
jgi:hypothetical protein